MPSAFAGEEGGGVGEVGREEEVAVVDGGSSFEDRTGGVGALTHADQTMPGPGKP